jgi:putative redox protein
MKIHFCGYFCKLAKHFHHKVVIAYHFYGSDLQEDKINKAVKLSVDQYCGVMEMFRQFAKVTTEVYLHKQ